jgi:hypothetical protein
VNIARVSDSGANRNDMIVIASNVIGTSSARKSVFSAVYWGKKKEKSVSDIMRHTGMSRVRVLQEAKKLADEGIIHQLPDRRVGQTWYAKIPFYGKNKKQILACAGRPDKTQKIPTKTSPRVNGSKVEIRIPRAVMAARPSISVKQITVDDIDSFAKVRRIKKAARSAWVLSEADFKGGIQAVIGEKGKFTDWGGETNDLYTTRIRMGRKRWATAFAFKGPGMQGELTPGKMGKNGDQIQRLFGCAADVFLIQYHGQIGQSVIEQMYQLAIAVSAQRNKTIYLGIVDGEDSRRIVAAYPSQFGGK